MGTDDTPESLGPSERKHYLNKYAPGKIDKGEVPRTPQRWEATASFWEATAKYGKQIERGLDVVFGLEQQGWTRNEPYRSEKTGRLIRVDRYLAPELSKDGIARNLEAKGGAIKNDRDLVQMQGYAEKCERGERVDYFTRAEREPQMSAPARELMDNLLRQYPALFRIRAMSEKVFQRVLQAGIRAVEKDERERALENIARTPEREREKPTRSVEAIARDYYRDINTAREQGREVGIDQLRFMTDALRGMANAQAEVDRDQVSRDREALGLRFIEGREVERLLYLKADDKHRERMMPIDLVTQELVERERIEVAKTAKEVQERITREREQGRELDLARVQREHLALGNTMGKVHGLEREILQEIARDLPKDRGEDFLHRMEREIEKRDERTMERIDMIGKTVEREEKARTEHAVRERESRARVVEYREQVREGATRAGLPPDIARMLEVSAVGPPTEVPERDAGEGERATHAARERERVQERDRLRYLGRQPGA